MHISTLVEQFLESLAAVAELSEWARANLTGVAAEEYEARIDAEILESGLFISSGTLRQVYAY